MNGPLLSVGEVAFLLGVSRRRVQWWIENGCLQVLPHPHSKGKHYRITQDELHVARLAIKHQKEFGIHFVSPGLFSKIRNEHGTEASDAGHSPA